MSALPLPDELDIEPWDVLAIHEACVHPRFAVQRKPDLDVALIQLAVGQDKAKNIEAAVNEIHRAKEKGFQLVALPECFNCPYRIECFNDYAEPIETGETSVALSKAAKDAGVCVVGGSFPERCGDRLFNTCTVWDHQGNLIATHRKIYLTDEESKVFKAGERFTTFMYKGLKIGVGIGSDIQHYNTTVKKAFADCALLIYPGAFDMTYGPRRWVQLCATRVFDLNLWIALVNRATDPGANTPFGHTMMSGGLRLFRKFDGNPGALYGSIGW